MSYKAERGKVHGISGKLSPSDVLAYGFFRPRETVRIRTRIRTVTYLGILEDDHDTVGSSCCKHLTYGPRSRLEHVLHCLSRQTPIFFSPPENEKYQVVAS
jgi:hypothetical protein